MRTVDCPACGAHFALPEDLYERKVAGRKTKVRCKVCGEQVRLDGTTRAGVEDLWVVSVGDDDRELSTSQVSDALKSGEIDSSAIVWKEGMEDWAAVDRVEHFAPALADRSGASEGTPNAQPPSSAAPPTGDPAAGSDAAVRSEPEPESSTVSEPAMASSAVPEPGVASSAVPEPATDFAAPAVSEPATNVAAPAVSELAAESGTSASDPGEASPAPVLFEAAPDSEGQAADLSSASRVPLLFEAPSEAEAGVVTEVETAPAVPVATRASRGDELHALFTIESMPPDPVDLDDSDMQSLPPSDVPPLAALRAKLVVPRAPRAPTRDLVGRPAEDAVVLAPPSVSALFEATPDPAESESPATDLEIPVDEDVDIPIDEDVTAPETLAAKRAQVAEAGPARRGRMLVVLGVGLAVIAGLIGIGLWQSPRSPAPASTEVTTEVSDVAVAARGAALAAESSERPAEAPLAADSRAGQGARSKPAPRSEQGPPQQSASSRAPASDRAASTPAPTPRESKPKPPGHSQAASSGNTFDKGAAIAALTAAAAAASSCRRGADPSGTATVLVTFAPSGRVTSANLSGPPFAGTATGGCIAAQMRTARVPRFSGGHVTVSKRVVIH